MRVKNYSWRLTKGVTIAGFLCSFTAVGGVGPIIGALYLTYCTISDKYNNLFAFLPVGHMSYHS